MTKLCRICLAFEKSIKFHSIFDDNEKVAKEILTLCGLVITNDNTRNESALICHECSSKLQDAVQLRNLCLESNCYFQELLMDTVEDIIVYENVEYIKSESDVEDDRLVTYCTVSDIKAESFEDYSLEMNNYVNEQHYTDTPTFYPYHHETFICDKCGEVVENRRRLESHFKSKHLQKSFKCFICMKLFTRNYDLMTHTRNVHHNQKVFDCHQCSKSFSMRWNLTRHVKNQHSGEQLTEKDNTKESINKSTCEICGLSFATESVMHSHKSVAHKLIEVHEQWLEKCPKCDKSMQTKTKLQRHISEVHEKKRLFRCENCFVSFSQKTNLERHIRAVHLEEKPYVCEICGKSFSEKAKLKIHNWTHTGVKLFKCNLCEKSYRRAHHLQKHSLSKHAG